MTGDEHVSHEEQQRLSREAMMEKLVDTPYGESVEADAVRAAHIASVPPEVRAYMKAKGAIEFTARQLASAWDAADNAAVRVSQARQATIDAEAIYQAAVSEAERLTADLEAFEAAKTAAELAVAKAGIRLAGPNGAGAAANNAMIRTVPNPEPKTHPN